MSQPTSLPPHLWDIKVEVEQHARDYGLDFFETSFEVLDYDRLSKGYTYGVQKIYEMVINNDPCYAYLLEGNSTVDQKTVMAHVFAHCDFFKNNYWFGKTNRKMMDEMANHASRIRRYIERYGLERQQRKIEKEKELRFPEEPERDVLKFLLDHAPLEKWEREVLDMTREEAYYFAPRRRAVPVQLELFSGAGHARDPPAGLEGQGLVPELDLGPPARALPGAAPLGRPGQSGRRIVLSAISAFHRRRARTLGLRPERAQSASCPGALGVAEHLGAEVAQQRG